MIYITVYKGKEVERLNVNTLIKKRQPNCKLHPDRKAEQWALLINPIWDEDNSGDKMSKTTVFLSRIMYPDGLRKIKMDFSSVVSVEHILELEKIIQQKGLRAGKKKAAEYGIEIIAEYPIVHCDFSRWRKI